MTARLPLLLLLAPVLLALPVGRAGALPTITCKVAASGASTVGQVTSVPSSIAQVDSSSAYAGKALRNANAVCTSTSGQVKYTLTKTKKTYCNSGLPPHASQVQLYPPTGEIAIWKAGWSWCHATGAADVTYSSSGKVRLRTKDPLFGVYVDAKQSTTAKVALGFLDVSGADRKQRIIVGPGEQVSVPAGGQPAQPQPARLTAGDQATIADLQPLVPPPSFDRPPAGSSDVLARMYARGTIRVGFDARSADSRVGVFVKRYFADLARNWKLELSLVNVPGASAAAALQKGVVDLEVTPAELPENLDVFPFFADAKSRLWRIASLVDVDWNGGLRTYVLATLTTGRYGTGYQAAFATLPPYDPLRPLLFP